MNKKAVLVIIVLTIVGILAVLGPDIYRLTFKSILDFNDNENNPEIPAQGESEDNNPTANQDTPPVSNITNFSGGGSSGGGGSGSSSGSSGGGNILPASEITRSFSSSTVHLGENLTVTLNVYLRNSETFYVLEDQIPNGLEIVDSGVGNISTPNYIKWIEYEDSQSTSYTYILNTTQRGTYLFAGEYFIEGFSSILQTGGANTILVI